MINNMTKFYDTSFSLSHTYRYNSVVIYEYLVPRIFCETLKNFAKAS